MTDRELLELAREHHVNSEYTEFGWQETNRYEFDLEELIRFAAPVRALALEEAAGVTGEFAQKWWSMHCASNKHMETTRKAHDDFCALQAAIRQLKDKT